MKVCVAIPTYKNFGKTISRTLNSLATQTYKDFRVLIVYKPFPGDTTLEVIDEYRNKLNIEVVVQKEGYVTEAMNITFKKVEEDVLIITDDDAIPECQFIRKHVSLHECYPRVGVVGGSVFPQSFQRQKSTLRVHLIDFLRLVNITLGYYKHLNKHLKEYLSYYNDMGLFVFNDPPLSMRETRCTMWVIGANMSIKKAVFTDFEVPCSTIRGSEYEFLVALHAILKGFKTILTSDIRVIHCERESLSRPKDPHLTLIEHAIAPYNVFKVYGYVNLKRLKNYLRVINAVKTFKKLAKRSSPFIESFSLTLPLAIKSIEENKSPSYVRTQLKEISKFYE